MIITEPICRQAGPIRGLALTKICIVTLSSQMSRWSPGSGLVTLQSSQRGQRVLAGEQHVLENGVNDRSRLRAFLYSWPKAPCRRHAEPARADSYSRCTVLSSYVQNNIMRWDIALKLLFLFPWCARSG